MDCCLLLPVSMQWRRRGSGYARLLTGSGAAPAEASVTVVVVGKERREFLVDPIVLEEGPFRVLMETTAQSLREDGNNSTRGREEGQEAVVLAGVDSILFEHMLWLMQNDCQSLFRLNLEEIIDFYADRDDS